MGSLFPGSSRRLPAVPVCILISSYKYTSQIGLGSILMASFYLNYLLKDPVFKYSHSLRYWGLGLEYMNWGGGDTVQPITLSVY